MSVVSQGLRPAGFQKESFAGKTAHELALAIEHGCEVLSDDTDFARLPGVRWRRPSPCGVTAAAMRAWRCGCTSCVWRAS